MATKKALVIDDEQIVLDSVGKILSSETYQVDRTLKAQKGIKMALEEPYDVVLTDIRMPDIGGLIVLRDIKRQKPSLPVVIITGYATVRSAVQAMQLGASDYIEKPFTPEQLIRSIAAAIELEKSQTPEEQVLVHKSEVLKVIDRLARDDNFKKNLLYNGTEVLFDYDLTKAEMLAIITGDLLWIEEQIGPLTQDQRKWFESRIGAEIW